MDGDSDERWVNNRSVSLLGVAALAALAALVSAQVTFSRDWSGGKRAPPAPADCSQLARLCRQFIHELKLALSTEKLQKMEKPRRVEHDTSFAYDDDK